MKPRNGAIIGLAFLATCSEEARDPSKSDIESAHAALGVSPPSEGAVWQKVGSSTTPDGRYLQAAAYDENRKVVVMFGGEIYNSSTYSASPSQETWEWSPATGKWTNRTAGVAPDPRSGAAMVFDPQRNKFVLFGGRAGSGYNFEDTWEWDPTPGTWTNISTAGSHPSARSQPGMVYEKSTGKVFLFGGGRSDPYSYDGMGVTVSLGDAWELDPATHAWTAVGATGGPSPRHDLGMVWDSSRNRVVLFAGMQTDIAGATGVPKQDTWEYDPETATWTERTTAGNKPSQRYAHAMTFDGSRGKAMVFGGWDISTGWFLSDLWEWDPGTGVWTQRLSDTSMGGPSGRLYASMISIDASARIEILAGAVVNDPYGRGGTGGIWGGPLPIYYGLTGSRDVWELDPKAATYVDRTAPLDVPSPRSNHAMAFDPSTGKSYLFGGYEPMTSTPLDDLWEWNGSTWARVATTVRPPARADAGLAYDPVRKSLILFGGTNAYGSQIFADTWEWTSSGGWSQLATAGSPDPLYGHGMVTDSVRGKILLFGGQSNFIWYPVPDPGAPWKDPMRNEVWEWDGAKLSWTNRTPTVSSLVPMARQYPALALDEARGKLFLYGSAYYSWDTGGTTSAFWEWDTTSAGWAVRDPGDWMDKTYNLYVVYDSIRRREIVLTDTANTMGGPNQTWELDARGPTWYVRSLSTSPSPRQNAAMAFDSARGVVVLFGGLNNWTGMWSNETWEYRVKGWGNGTGCTAAFATSCASGNCVDSVCCESATCTGPCQSCNVAGSEGSCLPVKAGTEVKGSCADGQACDGNGNCMSSNGQPCSSAATCASGFCTDGVCCDSACTGVCVSCNTSARAGKCSPYTAGTDPQIECGVGDGLCKSTCDGVGACVFPAWGQPCADCMLCDGFGKCSQYDPYCSFPGTGGFGGTGGYYTTARGGTGGYYTTSYGGTGGYYTTARGGTGGYYTTARGGTGGYYTTARGGSGAVTTARGGAGGYTTSYGGSGAVTTARGGAGGYYTTARGGSAGYTYPGSGGSGGKLDGGSPKGGSPGYYVPDAGFGITSARLHRTGCYCEVGQPSRAAAPGLSLPLLLAGAALARRLRRRRR
jgi:hypothetical protein